MKSLIFIFLILIFASSNILAKTESTVVPLVLTGKKVKGFELRSQTALLIKMVKAKNYELAEQLATQLLRSYEAQFNKVLEQYTFQSEGEYNEFKKTSSDKFEWIDWGYKECLQMQAFIKSEKRDFSGAIQDLRKIEKLAPISSATLSEIGYILNQLGKYDEALSVYRKAHDLSLKYATQHPYQAASLRGIGYSLTDLNQLDEAENAYRESLKLDPKNPIALKELKYIQSLRNSEKIKQSP